MPRRSACQPDHAGVSDLRRTARFYERLGFKQENESRRRRCRFFRSPARIALSLFDKRQSSLSDAALRRSPPCRPFAACRSPGTAEPKRKCRCRACDSRSSRRDAVEARAKGFLGRVSRLFHRSRRASLGSRSQSPVSTVGGRKTAACRTKRLHSGDPRCPRNHRWHEFDKPPARLPLKEEIVRPTFRRERKAHKTRYLAGRWLRRGRARTARRPRGRGCRRARSGTHPARAQRFQEADAARSAKRLYGLICATARGRRRLRLPRAHRPRQYPAASLWALAQAVAALPCRPKLVYVDGRDRIDGALRLRGRDLRRRAGLVHRRRLDCRQGHARPADDADRRCPSRLRLRAPYGLFGAGTFRGAANGSARQSITGAAFRRLRSRPDASHHRRPTKPRSGCLSSRHRLMSSALLSARVCQLDASPLLWITRQKRLRCSRSPC